MLTSLITITVEGHVKSVRFSIDKVWHSKLGRNKPN